MAESLTFNVGADTKGFQDGMSGMLTSIAGLVAAFVSAQAVIQAFGEAIDLGSRMNDLSTRTGETAGNLAILERAFENTGVGADKVGTSINKLQDAIIAAQGGTDKAVQAFAQLGLTWEDLQNLSPSEQLQLIGERLSGIHDPALRSATAIDIFGKAGGELIPILVNFASETAEAERTLGSLPQQLDASALSVDAFGDNLDAIGNKLTEVAYGFLQEVLPAVDSFVESLSGVDAAAIGAGLADALVGAFVAPMEAATLLGDTLILSAKLMGNELVYQVQYWSEVFLNTFNIIGVEIIPMLGSNMLGAFTMAAGGLGEALLNTIAGALTALEPIAEMFGLSEELQTAITSIQELAAGSHELMVQGAATIAESANTFEMAFASAQEKSTVVRQDFFGAEASSEQIKQDFAALQQLAKNAVDEFDVDTSDLAEARTTTGDTVEPAMQFLINENLVNQQPVLDAGGSSKPKTKTQAQLEAEAKADLALIAGVSPNQMTGSSYSAQRSLDIMQEMKVLEAQGKAGTAEYAALQRSLGTNLNIAFNTGLTSTETDAAWQWATQNMNEDWAQGMSVSELQKMAEENMLQQKQDAAGISDLIKDAEQSKDNEQQKGAAEKKPEQQKQTVQSIAQQLLALMQRVEPKIPQHIMA